MREAVHAAPKIDLELSVLNVGCQSCAGTWLPRADVGRGHVVDSESGDATWMQCATWRASRVATDAASMQQMQHRCRRSNIDTASVQHRCKDATWTQEMQRGRSVNATWESQHRLQQVPLLLHMSRDHDALFMFDGPNPSYHFRSAVYRHGYRHVYRHVPCTVGKLTFEAVEQ